MKAPAVCAAAALLAAALPPNLRAAETLLEFDRKFPPPALCLQQFAGFTESPDPFDAHPAKKPDSVALNDVDSRRFSEGALPDDSSAAWVLRARKLRAHASPEDWRRLEDAWNLYASRRDGALKAEDRRCRGDQIGTSFFFDLVYVVGAPFELIGSVSPDLNGKTTPSVALLPVAGAVGLATDPLFAVAHPFAKLGVKIRSRRADRALKRFADLVVELEKSRI